MEIVVTGGLGFVGSHLTQALLDAGHGVTVIGLRARQNLFSHENFQYVSADLTRPGPWQEVLTGAEVVVNLAGKSIFRRWTQSFKRQIFDSRILTTRNVVDALPCESSVTLCSTSAVGYYGDRAEERLTEEAGAGSGFLAEVARAWEAAAFEAQEKGIRVAAMRFGIVLGKNGGAMAQMVPMFRRRLGGTLGDGKQWMPWIHVADLVSAVLFVIENKEVHGVLNFCAPDPVRNRDFVTLLASVLNRPAVLPAPAMMLRAVMGEMASVLLGSQRVLPRRLLHCGFHFKYPELARAFGDLVN